MSGAREIVLDTETTGLDADNGDRIIEIGCVELVDFVITGKTFHKYVNPEREIPMSSTRIHGITTEMVVTMPKFSEIAHEFLDFIRDSTLVIHNARFDIKFLEMEMSKSNRRESLPNNVIDTIDVARKKYPGQPASLDALCKRLGISTHEREFHGALKDATLLARVYVEMCGGLQRSLNFSKDKDPNQDKLDISTICKGSALSPRSFPISPEEIEQHRAAVYSKLQNPIWDVYFNNNKDD